MKKTLRGLGIGLFLAGAVFTAMDYSDTPPTPQTTAQYNEKIHALEQQLKQANEKIATLEEAEQQETPPKDSVTSTEETKTEEPAETTDEPEAEKVSGTIYVYEGVSLYDIGKQAEDAGIIQNSRELELFLAKPEYAKSIQKGQFELSSDMTLEEMALILTGKADLQ